MKKILIVTIIFLNLCSIFAQYPRASLWTSAMSNFAALDAANGIQKDVVLFAGSSTFTMWNSLQTDFPKSKVLNRAFGGSMMTDLIYFFHQVVAPYNPRQVVLYEGDNDLHETSKTPEGFMEDVIAMTRLINIYFPGAEIILVSIKPSPSRTISFPKYETANALMKAYADKNAHIKYVDTWTPMLRQDGTPETSYFGSDMLHMNASGYTLWKSILEPYLLTSDFETPDKTVFTESSHARYHDFSWVNVTAPSIFNTVKSEKISTDSTYFHSGKTSLKLDYQGNSGGNWMACVAGPDWIAYDIQQSKALEFWVYAPVAVSGNDLPRIYLESKTGSVTSKLNLNSYLSQLTAANWTKVSIPIQDWKNESPEFTYDNVKTVFFSQQNVNSAPVQLFIDDIVFKADNGTTNPNAAGDIFIDFGSNAAGFPTPGNWNNIHDHQAANVTLIDDNGDDTGMTLKITDPFYNGFNTNGPTSVSGDATVFPGTATSDNFFGHTLDWGSLPANPKGVFTITGLNTQKYYSFTIFASRMGVSDNREAKYSIEAKSGIISQTLNSSDNSTKVANITNVQSNTSGEITFTVEAGENNNNITKFFYIGALRISSANQPNAVKPVSNRQKMIVSYQNGTLKLDDYTGKVEVLDVGGRALTSGQAVFGYFPVHLKQGLYFVLTEKENSTVFVN